MHPSHCWRTRTSDVVCYRNAKKLENFEKPGVRTAGKKEKRQAARLVGVDWVWGTRSRGEEVGGFRTVVGGDTNGAKGGRRRRTVH